MSNTETAIQSVTIQNFHGHANPGYFLVQAPDYFAWMDHQEPGLLRVRHPSGEGLDWFEIRLSAALLAPGEELETDELFEWEELEASGDDVLPNADTAKKIRILLSGERSVTVRFEATQITLQLTSPPPAGGRIKRCVLGANGSHGTVANAKCIFDTRPASHGIYRHALTHKLDTKNLWFSPGPFCYPFELEDDCWASVSAEPTIEEMSFSQFVARPTDGGMMFCLDYDSEPVVDGEYVSPPLVWRFNAPSPTAAITDYAKSHATRAGFQASRPEPEPWWTGLMLCGWVNQGRRSKDTGKTAQENATQEIYEAHIAAAEAAGIEPDIITIDDNWAISHGDWVVDTQKWPDLPGFIARQHEKGRKVLLWVCAATTGLPDDELYRVGDPPYKEWFTKQIDPFNPNWLDRLQRNLSAILGNGDGCLDADGLKLDFTGNLPVAGKHHATRELHGIAHTWWFFKRVHDAAKAAKPDCLLDFQVSNPLFAQFHDMTRLNDCFMPMRQARRAMRTRAEIAKAAAFSPLIDTDAPHSVEWFNEVESFGNPSLYLANKHFEDKELVAAIRESRKRLLG